MRRITQIMITGANRGIGKETARQVAALEGIEKIYLACRNLEKAKAAQASLEHSTGKKIFELIIMDVSNTKAVKEALHSFSGQLDALVLNAGGLGGSKSFEKNPSGVTAIFAVNVLGHFILVEELITKGQLKGVVLYSGSEAARGLPRFGLAQAQITNASVDYFRSIANGDYFDKLDKNLAYARVKLMATLGMAKLSRKYPSISFITMSPGFTETSSVADAMPSILKVFFKYIALPYLLPLIGMGHRVNEAAARYLEGLTNDQLESGHFYASKANALTGPIMDQSEVFPAIMDKNIQDNAYQAIRGFIK